MACRTTCATSSACTWCIVSSPKLGSASSSPRAICEKTSGSTSRHRIDRRPPRPDDVARPEDRGRKAVPRASCQQPGLDERLRRPVLAERDSADGPRSRAPPHCGRRPRWSRNAGDDRPRPRRASTSACVLGRSKAIMSTTMSGRARDPRAESARGILSRTVRCDRLHGRPGGMGTLGRGLPSADVDHLVPTLHVGRHEIRPHVPAAADNHRLAPSFFPRLQEPPAAVRRPESPPLRPPAPRQRVSYGKTTGNLRESDALRGARRTGARPRPSFASRAALSRSKSAPAW